MKTLPKILIITAVLILLLKAAQPSYAAEEVTLSLSPSSGEFSSSFTVKVMLDTGTQEVGAVDIYLSFEPDSLDISASGISAAGNFSVAGKSIDESQKQIDFTVYGSAEFSGSAVHLANLSFTPLKSSGTTAVNYIFKGAGETGDSGVFYAGSDILTAVSGATYTLAGAEEQEETHKECQSDQCVTVSGAGSDECSTDADCETGNGEDEGTGGTGGTGAQAGSQATTSAAPKTAGGVDFTIFLALFALSLIGSGIWLALVP